jgi:uncharacterized protein (TIGR01244 family)
LELKRINDTITVSGQVLPEDMAELKALGFTSIINNRPDGEAPDQPSSNEMAAAAAAEGLSYTHIPLGRDGVSPALVEATRKALSEASGPVFAFCRSGTRSTTLWALSQAGERPAQEIIGEAAHAGYDMSHLAAHLGQA